MQIMHLIFISVSPLVQVLASHEENGVYIEKLGASIKGTVLYVVADNLAPCALAGFQESFCCRENVQVLYGYTTRNQKKKTSAQVFTH